MGAAIRVENLGKCYRVDREPNRPVYRTIREGVTGAAAKLCRPWRRRSGHAEIFWALEGVDFEVRPGEAVGVIGRNGAGKSTLLKVLSRITRPSTGQVTLRGRVGSLLEVGTGFHPELTGRENVYLNGTMLGMSRREIAQKFDEIVAFAEVESFLDLPVKRYSSGMYVRLGFAVAAHLDPQILLVDEVLSVGDHAFQRRSLSRMEEIKENGTTVLFVSHNLQSVAQMCPTSIVLSQGRVVFAGKTPDAINAYYREAARRPGSARPAAAGGGIEAGVIRGGAVITRLQLTDAHGRAVNALSPGEQVCCDMEIQFEEDAEGPIPACFIKSPRGFMIYDINTTWAGLKTGSFRRGQRYLFRWNLTCNLLPGQYFLGADLARSDLAGYYDRLEFGVPFEVVGGSGARGIAELGATLRVEPVGSSE